MVVTAADSKGLATMAARADRDLGAKTAPQDWRTVSFADLFEFRNGVNADGSAYGKGTRFINVLEVITKTHLHESDIPGRVSLPSRLLDAYVVRPGDVLFNRTSETQEEVGLSSVYLGHERVVFGGFVIRGRPKTALLDPTYSGYALRSHPVRTQIVAKGQGGIRSNIGQVDLRQVVVVLPDRVEQGEIGAALSAADDLSAALDELIGKKRAINVATVQRLLTGRTRLPGFEGSWRMASIDDVCSRRPGAWGEGAPSRARRHGISIVGVGDITREGELVGSTWRYLSDREMASALTRAGDVLFAASGEPGKAWLNDGTHRVGAANFLRVLEPLPDRVMGPYLFYALRTNLAKGAVTAATSASVISNIDPGFFGSRWLPLPPVVEQAAIAQVLSEMHAEIDALEQRREKTAAIRAAMAQALLTGRVRVMAATTLVSGR